MSLIPFQPVQPSDSPSGPSKREFLLGGNRTRDTIAQLLRPVVDGLLLEGVVLTGGVDAVVNHGLGRTLRGWLIVRNTASGSVFDKQAANLTPETTLVLSTATTKTISLWVF